MKKIKYFSMLTIVSLLFNFFILPSKKVSANAFPSFSFNAGNYEPGVTTDYTFTYTTVNDLHAAHGDMVFSMSLPDAISVPGGTSCPDSNSYIALAINGSPIVPLEYCGGRNAYIRTGTDVAGGSNISVTIYNITNPTNPGIYDPIIARTADGGNTVIDAPEEYPRLIIPDAEFPPAPEFYDSSVRPTTAWIGFRNDYTNNLSFLRYVGDYRELPSGEWESISDLYSYTGEGGPYGDAYLNGLKPGTDYELRVSAENGKGLGVYGYYQFTTIATKQGPEETILTENRFKESGVAQNWRGDDDEWEYELPFSVNFYGEDYDTVYVSSNGYVSFGRGLEDYNFEISEENMGAPFISAISGDLRTDGEGGTDIFIDDSKEGEVRFRWKAIEYDNNYNELNFEIVLYSNNDFEINYGNFSEEINEDNNAAVGVNDGEYSFVASVYDERRDFDRLNTSYWTWGATSPDTNPPIYEDFEGGQGGINIKEGQFINTNPYTIKVKPSDSGSGMNKVEFYVDDNLLCTEVAADSNGIYSCDWDTSKYHSIVKVIAYDNSGNQAEIVRNTTVDPKLYMKELPKTGK